MNIWKKQCLEYCCCCVSLNTGVVIILVITLLIDVIGVVLSKIAHVYFVVNATFGSLFMLIWVSTIVGVCCKKVILVLCGEIGYVAHAGFIMWQTFVYSGNWHIAAIITEACVGVVVHIYIIIVMHSLFREMTDINDEEEN